MLRFSGSMTRWPCVDEIPLSAGVVVDLDDTLYSEYSFHDSAFRYIAVRVGLDPAGNEIEAARAELRRSGRPLDLLSEITGIEVSRLLEWHRYHEPTISPYPDARAFLHRLDDAGIPVVLLTDGRSITQQNKIDALGIRQLLTKVLVSEEVGVSKFNVDAFLRAAEELASRTPVVSFGDNPLKDVDQPIRLGWRVYLMRSRGDNVHSQMVSAGCPDQIRILASFDEIGVAAHPARNA